MRNEPSIKEQTLTDSKLGEKLQKFLNDLWGKVTKDDDDRAIWKNKMIASSNQRLGVKRYTNFPYDGAPNIPLPETDKLIKKSTPNLVLSAWNPKKLCTVRVEQGILVTPEMTAKAKKAELAMNVILRTKIDLYNKLEVASDYAKEKGHCVFKTVEKFTSRIIHKTIDVEEYPDEQLAQLKQMIPDDLRRFVSARYELDLEEDDDKKIVSDIVEQFNSGERFIEFDLEEIYSMPDIETPNPDKIIVPSYTNDIEHSYRITEEFDLTRQEIEERIKNKIYLDINLDFVGKGKETNSYNDYLEENKMRNEGLTDTNSGVDLYRIRETICWHKPDDKDTWERWVFTYLAEIANPNEALLRRRQFPFEFDEWNYNRFDNEVKGKGHYSSRGVPEQIRALQDVMERNVNNMLVRDDLNNTPIWEVADTSEILTRGTRFKPGELVPVSQLGTEIRQLNTTNTVDVSSERMMQILKAWAEEYLGSTDQLFRNSTNAGGGKTLGEIQMGFRQVVGQTQADVIRWNNCLSKVYLKIFKILGERVGEDLWIDGVRVTKEDFNFPAEIRSNGTLEISDADMATQKAFMRLQTIVNFIQVGIVNQEDAYNALKDWLEKDGVVDPDLFATNPQEINNTIIAQQQQQIQQQGQLIQASSNELESLNKDVAKAKRKGKDIVSKTQGELEAVYDTSKTIGRQTGTPKKPTK